MEEVVGEMDLGKGTTDSGLEEGNRAKGRRRCISIESNKVGKMDSRT
jgi:hypothetical protein